jgi:PPP family 3-phenylpropionic acid transporter
MRRTLLPFKAFYFFSYAALAFVAPFLTLYYEGLGLSGNQIGVLAAIPSLVTFISAPVFGAIADITQRHKRILGVSIIFVIVGILMISLVRTFFGLIPGVFVYAFFFAPALPLIDRSVIDILGADRDQYGKQRLWGAVGWGALAPVAGWVIARGGLAWGFYGSAILFFGLFIVSQLTPVKPVKIQVNFWNGLSRLFASRQVVIFFSVILVGGMGLAFIHHYLFLYLSHLGASPVVMGSALTVATTSELVVMYFADRLLKSWKARGMILFGLLMITLRLILYAFTTSPYVALLIQLMHGPTFAAIWMAGVAYVAEIAPDGLGNTAQGLFSGVVMGLGSALGGLLGGFLYQSVGFSRMFLIASSLVFLAFLVFWFACRPGTNCD